MNRRRLFYAFLLILLFVGAVEFLLLNYRHHHQTSEAAAKKAAVTLTGLPDLALATEARFIRHRSLSSLQSAFGEDGTLREYFPASFAYTLPAYHHAQNRIDRER